MRMFSRGVCTRRVLEEQSDPPPIARHLPHVPCAPRLVGAAPQRAGDQG